MPNNFAPTALTPQHSHPGSSVRDNASASRGKRTTQGSPLRIELQIQGITARINNISALIDQLDTVRDQLKENSNEQIGLEIQLQEVHEAERVSWKKRRSMIAAAKNCASKIQNSSLLAKTHSLYALYDSITGKKISGFPRKVEDIEAMSDHSISGMLIALGELPYADSDALRRQFETTIGLRLPFRPPPESWVRPRRYPRKEPSSTGRITGVLNIRDRHRCPKERCEWIDGWIDGCKSAFNNERR